MWNWALGSGLAGLIAGIRPTASAAVRSRWLWVAIATGIGAVGILIGIGLSALTDIWVANLTPDLAISAEWLPTATRDLLVGVPTTAVFLVLWAWFGGGASVRRGSERTA